MNKRRVVITGTGMITPLGHNTEDTWAALLAGKSGIHDISEFLGKDHESFPVRFGGLIRDFDPTQYLSKKDVRKFDGFVHYAVAAAAQAMQDAGIEEVDVQMGDRMGVALGSGIGGISSIEESHEVLMTKGPRKVLPSFIPGAICNIAAGLVSMQYGFRGPNLCIVTACTTGAHNIGEAARLIAYGDADVMIAGGAEKASRLGIAGFSAMRALSQRNDDPEAASRPWDRDRDGFVLAEGAGIVVLEEYEHAKRRGANIYCELIGYGLSADAYHITLPDGIGAESAMRHSLKDANINPDQVDYINAHATSTIAGDLTESQAIERVFGDHARTKLAVSGTKSMTGHSLGAIGAVEAIFCALALRDQVVPPTINLDNPAEGCNLDYVPKIARQMKVNIAVSNSFGFGGTNASIVLRKI
ncbi:MAG: beta-ketoacyl-ACP synthase II [Gammaproteobacteria bacterium]